MPAIQLYSTPLSGHCHRVVLLLNMLSLPFETTEAGAAVRQTEEFAHLNPLRQIPVLIDGGLVLTDSNAILVYLAKKAGRSAWLPDDPLGAAQVQRWLSVAAGELAYGPGAARLITVFGRPFNPDEVITRAHNILALMDQHLTGREWLVGDHPTVADKIGRAHV